MKILRFVGTFEHAIDTKGRVSVPRKLLEVLRTREEQAEEFEVYLAAGLDGCLWLYPSQAFDGMCAVVDQGAVGDEDQRQFARLFLGRAEGCPVDKAGRLLIPPRLRSEAGLNEKVTLVGVGSRIELWEPAAWEAYASVGRAKYEQQSKGVFL